MADALTIAFEVTGADRITAAFASFEKRAEATTQRMAALTSALESATNAYKALNAEAEKFNRMQGGGMGGGPAIPIGRGVSRAGASAPASERYTSGPFQRQQQLSQQMSRALAQGNGRAVADVGLAQDRNEKVLKRVTSGPKGLGASLADVLKTSRFSLGESKSIMPLVGKTLGAVTQALGPEIMAIAGPIGLVAAAALGAASAMFELVKASAEAGAAYGKFTYAIGSQGAGASQAMAVGRLAGLDASGTAGMAQNLNSAITGSAMGRMFGQRVGVFNQAAPYGDVDLGKQLVTAIEGLRSIKNFDERVRTMNALGLQGASGAVLASDKQYALGKGDASVTQSIMDPDFQQKSVDFQSALGRVSTAWDNLMVTLGKPGLDAGIGIMNSLASALNSFALVMNSAALQTTLKVLGMVVSPLGAVIAQAGEDPHTTAQKETTAAIKEQTVLMKTPGTYGKDTDGRLGRAQGSGYGFGADSRNRDQLMRQGYAMGAF